MARLGAFADAWMGVNSARLGGGSTSCGLTAALFEALVCGDAEVHGDAEAALFEALVRARLWTRA